MVSKDDVILSRESKQAPMIGAPSSLLRLLQFQPAWTIHALLRFRKIQYTCENIGYMHALGRNLPVLIDGNYILTEKIALDYIHGNRNVELLNNKIGSEDSTCNVSSTTLSNGSKSTDSVTYSNAKVLQKDINAYDDIDDKAIASYIQCSTVDTFAAMIRLKGIDRSIITASVSYLLGWMICLRKDFYQFILGNDRKVCYNDKNTVWHDAYLLHNIKMMEAKLLCTYDEITYLLDKYNGHLTAEGLNTGIRGTADAILFGHLADVLSYDSQYYFTMHKSILIFFESVCREYFTEPMIWNHSYSQVSRRCTDAILSNAFLSNSQCSYVKKLIAYKSGPTPTPTSSSPRTESIATYSVTSDTYDIRDDAVTLCKIVLKDVYSSSKSKVRFQSYEFDESSHSEHRANVTLVHPLGIIYISAVFTSFLVYIYRANM